jgi:hypothetical protein
MKTLVVGIYMLEIFSDCFGGYFVVTGLVLQAFKLRLEDPLGALSNWNDSDVTPCKWKGVVCNNVSQVVTFM